MPSTTSPTTSSPARAFDAEDATDPIKLAQAWLSDASRTEPTNSDAAALATATPDGLPSVRMVLIKRIDGDGFRFFTNAESQKGRELAENPRAALCFYWKSQRRQLRVEGAVHEIAAEESDRYFRSRERGSKLGAALSAQSRPLDSRSTLEKAAEELGACFPGEVPRPAYWRGYSLLPDRIEFWQEGASRLHDRILFFRTGTEWSKHRLYP